MENVEALVRKIIERKKRFDLAALKKAESEGLSSLLVYLDSDLKAAGIDPRKISISLLKDLMSGGSKGSSSNPTSSSPSSFPSTSPQSSSSSSSTSLSPSPSIPAILESVSLAIDTTIFEPYFRSSNSSNTALSLLEKIDKRLYSEIESRLRTPKLAFLALATWSAGYCLSGFLRSKLIPILFYGVLTVDFMRLAFNCYTRQYISLFADDIGGDLMRLGKTFLDWMSSGADPLKRLREGGINYHLLLNKTIMQFCWTKFHEALEESKKRR